MDYYGEFDNEDFGQFEDDQYGTMPTQFYDDELSGFDEEGYAQFYNDSDHDDSTEDSQPDAFKTNFNEEVEASEQRIGNLDPTDLENRPFISIIQIMNKEDVPPKTTRDLIFKLQDHPSPLIRFVNPQVFVFAYLYYLDNKKVYDVDVAASYLNMIDANILQSDFYRHFLMIQKILKL